MRDRYLLSAPSTAALVALLALVSTAVGPGQSAAAAQDSAALRLETFEAAWGIIAETHFDAAFNGVDWPAVRDELLPHVEAADSTTELRAIINDMLLRLGQSHFALWPREALGALGRGEPSEDPAAAATGGNADPGFAVTLIDEGFAVSRVDPTGPAAGAGVRPGWIVRSLDGVDVTHRFEELAEHVDEHQARVEAQRGLAAGLRGTPGSELVIEFLDDRDSPRQITLQRRLSDGLPTRFGNMPPLLAHLESEILEPDIGLQVGFIRFNIWLLPLAAAFDEAIDTMRRAGGIVLDLRGNPGGIGGMVMGIGGHFVDEHVSLGTMRTRDNELQFVANPRLVDGAGNRVEPLSAPLAILIDNTSASTSEVFAAGLQAAGRARVFGQRSMGAVLPSMMDRLPNGDILQHAFADFVVTQSGERLEGRGVIPDEKIRITRRDLLAGRDPTLDAALEWIVLQQ